MTGFAVADAKLHKQSGKRVSQKLSALAWSLLAAWIDRQGGNR